MATKKLNESKKLKRHFQIRSEKFNGTTLYSAFEKLGPAWVFVNGTISSSVEGCEVSLRERLVPAKVIKELDL